MNRKRFISVLCLTLICTGICAKTYSSKVLAFDYPDDFSLTKEINSDGLLATIYSNDSTALVQFKLTKVSKPITTALPSLLKTMQSQTLRELTQLTKHPNVRFGNYQSVKFQDPQDATLTYLQGAQRAFEEKTTDGKALEGKIFIAVDGKEFLEVIFLTSDEKHVDALNETLTSVRFGSALSSRSPKKNKHP